MKRLFRVLAVVGIVSMTAAFIPQEADASHSCCHTCCQKYCSNYDRYYACVLGCPGPCPI